MLASTQLRLPDSIKGVCCDLGSVLIDEASYPMEALPGAKLFCRHCLRCYGERGLAIWTLQGRFYADKSVKEHLGLSRHPDDLIECTWSKRGNEQDPLKLSQRMGIEPQKLAGIDDMLPAVVSYLLAKFGLVILIRQEPLEDLVPILEEELAKLRNAASWCAAALIGAEERIIVVPSIEAITIDP